MQLSLDSLFGKTSPESSVPQTTLSAAFSPGWWARIPHSFQHEGSGGLTRVWLLDPKDGRRGASWMPNTSAWPNGASVCLLSDVLETGPIPQKYFLSEKACRGILRRAEKRGKELPELLARALRVVAGLELTSTLTEGSSPNASTGGAMRRIDAESETLIAQVAPTLRAGGNRTGGDRPPGTDVDTCETLIAHSLRAEGHDANEDGTGRGVPLVAATLKSNGDGGGLGSDPSENFLPVAFQESQTGTREYDTAGTLRSDGPGHDPVGTRVRDGMAVRRLTPTECERLQGFPDGYTQVEYRGKEAADGPRYRALGNSMAVPVMAWLGARILEAVLTR